MLNLFEYLDGLCLEYGEVEVRRALKKYLRRKTSVGVVIHRQTIPKNWTEDAYLAQQGICKRCRNDVLLKDATGDHIIALARGGTHSKKNIQMLCRSCNSSKGANDHIRESKKINKTVLEQIT